jgi:hypothetical protein
MLGADRRVKELELRQPALAAKRSPGVFVSFERPVAAKLIPGGVRAAYDAPDAYVSAMP